MIIDLPSDKVFFTSDMHFGHRPLMKFNKRPFDDEQVMDQTLISNWNLKVPHDGLTFVLGDIGEVAEEYIAKIFKQLNGSKILIQGNHDCIYKQDTLDSIFEEVHLLLDITVSDSEESKGQKIVLCHYPLFDWDDFHEGSWHLFGHLHTRDIPEFEVLKGKLFPQQYDVGVDGNDFRPVSFREIKTIIAKQSTDSSFKQSNYSHTFKR